MNNKIKVMSLASMTLFLLGSCAESEPSSIVDLIDDLELGELSSEDLQTLNNSSFIAEIGSDDYTSFSYMEDIYYPVYTWNTGYEDQTEYTVRTDTISYYDNNVVTVTGDYYHAGWDQESTAENYGSNYGFGTATSYSYDEVIYVEGDNDSINAIYTRDDDASANASFAISTNFNWTLYDYIFTNSKFDTYDYMQSYVSQIQELADYYIGSYSSYGYSSVSDYEGSKTVDEDGNIIVDVNHYDRIEVLPYYTAELVWGSSYKYMYVYRALTFEYSYTITNGKLTYFEAVPFGYFQKVYYDLNEVELEDLSGEYDAEENFTISEEDLALMNLVELEYYTMYTVYYEIYSFAVGFEEKGDYDLTTLPDSSNYRSAYPTDVGDNVFFNIYSNFNGSY